MVDLAVSRCNHDLWFMMKASPALEKFRNANYIKYVYLVSKENINGSNINILEKRRVQKQHAIPCKQKFLCLKSAEFLDKNCIKFCAVIVSN
jgi:myosin-crossreactive antigen